MSDITNLTAALRRRALRVDEADARLGNTLSQMADRAIAEEQRLLARISELEAICDEQRQRLDALFDGTESTPALVKIARLEAQVRTAGAEALEKAVERFEPFLGDGFSFDDLREEARRLRGEGE